MTGIHSTRCNQTFIKIISQTISCFHSPPLSLLSDGENPRLFSRIIRQSTDFFSIMTDGDDEGMASSPLETAKGSEFTFFFRHSIFLLLSYLFIYFFSISFLFYSRSKEPKWFYYFTTVFPAQHMVTATFDSSLSKDNRILKVS